MRNLKESYAYICKIPFLVPAGICQKKSINGSMIFHSVSVTKFVPVIFRKDFEKSYQFLIALKISKEAQMINKVKLKHV